MAVFRSMYSGKMWFDTTCRGEELLELLQKPTAKENATVEKFRTGGASVREYCPQLTKEDCCR